MLRVPDPYAGPTTLGIDVSFYQKRIDYQAVAQAGIKFAICRMGDGLGLDSTFKVHYQGFRSAGIIVGSYQFVRPLEDTKMEARRLLGALSMVGFSTDDIAPMIDTERGDDPNAPRLVHFPQRVGDSMLAWAGEIESQLKVRPMCYGGEFFAEAIHDPRLAAFPLVTPLYGPTPAIPKQWVGKGWSFWQFDSSHAIPGVIGKAVDHDVFRGDLDALKAFVKAQRLVT